MKMRVKNSGKASSAWICEESKVHAKIKLWDELSKLNRFFFSFFEKDVL